MKYLKISKLPPMPVSKPYFTVGCGSGFDLSLDTGTNKKHLLFALKTEGENLSIIPGEEKTWINSKHVTTLTALFPSDRIECHGAVIVVLDEPMELEPNERINYARCSMEILHELACDFEKELSQSDILHKALGSMVRLAGAERGFLVSEKDSFDEWQLKASYGDPRGRNIGPKCPPEFISNSILSESIEKKKPLYIESVIGHPLSDRASVIASRLYSLACLPLVLGERVFGALYLYTHSPGVSICKESLGELSILATHLALIMASAPKKSFTSSLDGDESSSILYDRSDTHSAMAKLSERIHKLSGTDLNLVITGETGTGKELVAREVHQTSSRSKGPFVAVNCAAIPTTLMESVLFGYVKGAFTGALKDRAGKFALAHGGTLFLDEIGDLPLELQAKLLRVLQEKEIEAVGADTTTKVDFRVVCATHKDISQLIKEGKFREDLYYRLNGAVLGVPALRDRKSDIRPLAQHFLNRMKGSQMFSESAFLQLENHTWPGNVRELEQVIARASALASGNEITPSDLEIDVSNLEGRDPMNGSENYEDRSNSLREAQDAFTKDLIQKALMDHNGNRSRAAKALGISERTLYRLLP